MSGTNVGGSLVDLSTRSGIESFLAKMWSAASLNLQQGNSVNRLFQRGAIHKQSRAEAEVLLRTFWGPILLPEKTISDASLGEYIQAIQRGTEPGGAGYWGDLEAHDQFAVEMPILALSLVLAREKIWSNLPAEGRAQIASWLAKINEIKIPANNWNVFVIVVNVCLKLLGCDYCDKSLNTSIANINSYYVGDGWYVDGDSKRVDHYIAFSIHYYLLIVRVIYPEIEEHIVVRARAEQFATQYARLFSSKGDALPYGRSLSYRFAQASFWGALAFADIEALPWGEIRGIYARNLRYWSNQNIVSGDGMLTVGYDYPNDLVAEYYIGSGSPYWSFSAFIALLVPKEHPFWTCTEQCLNPRLLGVQSKMPGLIIASDESFDHVVALSAGQCSAREFGGSAEKYAKFAYSNHFGFSLSREASSLECGAFDSTIAFRVNEGLWATRRRSEHWEVDENTIVSTWSPFCGVTVKSRVVSLYPWHLRVHYVSAEHDLDVAEGAFSVPYLPEERGLAGVEEGGRSAILHGSGIIDLSNNRTAGIVRCFPNTNIKYQRTGLPMISGQFERGEFVLSCLVLGEANADRQMGSWRMRPDLRNFEHLWDDVSG